MAMDIRETVQLNAGASPRVVGARYVLRRSLGEGGMASVLQAHDSVLGRSVAVKILHAKLARDPSFRERFRREAKAAAALNHPNIVAVHDSGEDADDAGVVQYIVMEYVQGRSLAELIRGPAAESGGGVIALDRALEITESVLEALACSHRSGLVHRDIKPANVMVTDDGIVKVMDFGIALALQTGATSMTQAGTVLGTPQYLSPEQALGRPADTRSDLYSVGCMLFELLTGATPFDGDSTMSVLHQHVRQTPPVPSMLNPSLPAAVDAIVARALDKDPAQRHPNANAMADEIRWVRTGGAAGGQLPPRELPTVGDDPARARRMPSRVPFAAVDVQVGLSPRWDVNDPRWRRVQRFATIFIVLIGALAIAALCVGAAVFLRHIHSGLSGGW
ncbi:protein kinase [Kitasatospora sp. NPDC049258]|uniref:protein kinase domain-containing protein n=1 Tax=Kitasatospora sp. NPDC049258 TaxID=3155394 RepID=UPI00343CB9AA